MTRGEWSLNKVTNIYFKFGYDGGCYLGQVLSLKDVNSANLGVLSAHFKDPSNPQIDVGVECCFHVQSIAAQTETLQIF